MAASVQLPRRNTVEIMRDGYTVLQDVYIITRDGSILCANVYLPTRPVEADAGKFPTILSIGPYGKDIHFAEFGKPNTNMYADMAKEISPLGPDACFETPDPIIWCKEFNYALVRVDTRGSGGSPGRLDPFGLMRSYEINADAEGQDAYDVIEWAAAQNWSNRRVAMCGISYFGMICYWAAMQNPPHLTAIVPYEALSDKYGHVMRQGGVFHSGFQSHWYNNIVVPGQYGKSDNVDESALAENRVDFTQFETLWVWRSEGVWPVFDRERSLRKIKVPMLSAGNWMDSEIHLPGNPVAFEQVSSTHKFLEMHTGNHLGDYYQPHQIQRQRQFLDYFLLDKKDNGLDVAPRIELLIRKGTDTFYREEPSWPPSDADYVSLSLQPGGVLGKEQYQASSPEDAVVYSGLDGAAEFQTEPFPEDFEILGYPYLNLSISTDAKDMDVFIYFYLIDPKGEKVIFRGNHDEPAASFLRSWFRLSHRTLSDKSTQHRPLLDQQKPAPVVSNEVYSVQIPVPPTSMIVSPQHRLAIALRANDEDMIIPPMRHISPDRPKNIFAGKNRICYGGELVVPVVKR